MTEHLLGTFLTEFDGIANPLLGLFQENLACETPTTAFAWPLFQEQGNTFIMFQMLQSWRIPHQNPLLTDICLTDTQGPDIGIAYGFSTFNARYFELYTADLDFPGFNDALQGWHDTLATLPGDFDGDGDVDLDDFTVFQACFTGVDGGPLVSGCQPGDFDGDEDIDCDDWTAFSTAFMGPGDLPPFSP